MLFEHTQLVQVHVNASIRMFWEVDASKAATNVSNANAQASNTATTAHEIAKH